jgi:hypothetical protein
MGLSKNQKIIAKVLEKAWEDEQFIKDLVANPEEAIKASTGESLDLPEGKKLVVVDQTDSSNFYLNIPSEPDMEEIELTDEQLELIAGGANLAVIIAAGVDS